jgi:hypothetical protein
MTHISLSRILRFGAIVPCDDKKMKKQIIGQWEPRTLPGIRSRMSGGVPSTSRLLDDMLRLQGGGWVGQNEDEDKTKLASHWRSPVC